MRLPGGSQCKNLHFSLGCSGEEVVLYGINPGLYNPWVNIGLVNKAVKLMQKPMITKSKLPKETNFYGKHFDK